MTRRASISVFALLYFIFYDSEIDWNVECNWICNCWEIAYCLDTYAKVCLAAFWCYQMSFQVLFMLDEISSWFDASFSHQKPNKNRNTLSSAAMRGKSNVLARLRKWRTVIRERTSAVDGCIRTFQKYQSRLRLRVSFGTFVFVFLNKHNSSKVRSAPSSESSSATTPHQSPPPIPYRV